jgi:26S proteasome non-ATPase regulatory subunit 9
VRIIELKNDVQTLVDQIAVALQNVAEDDASTSRPSGNASDQPKLTNGVGHPNVSDENSPDSSKPFARVDGVAPGSPAAEAVSIFSFV